MTSLFLREYLITEGNEKMKMKEIFLSFVSLFASLAFVVLFIFIGKYLCQDLHLVVSI